MRCFLLPALLASSLACAESGTLMKDTELRAKPFGDAAVVTDLQAKSNVDILSRKGAWANVKAGSQSGWVRLLLLRTGSGERGDSGVGALASMFRTGSSGSTVSTGVKGLSEEQLKDAKPDPAEVQQLDSYRDDAKDARRFAQQAKLNAREVGYLSAPNGKVDGPEDDKQ